VIAHQQNDRHARVGQTFDAAAKFTLKGGVRALIFISIAGKDADIKPDLLSSRP
jgi:hypothetical protein